MEDRTTGVSSEKGGEEFAMSRIRLLAVVPTLGTSSRLGAMVRSLSQQSRFPDEVVFCLQGERTHLDAVLESCALANDERVNVVECQRGASRARNYGVLSSSIQWTHVVFLDDDIRYDEVFIERTISDFREDLGDILTAVIRPEGEGRARSSHPCSAREIQERNIWEGSLEAGSAYTRDSWVEGGGFDVDLGVGADTPWQSGESTDLILRLIRAGFRASLCPDRVGFEESPSLLPMPDRILRARRYARGTGRVYSMRLSMWSRIQLVLKSVVRVAVDTMGLREFAGGAEARQVLIGRLEGLWGTTLDRSPRMDSE